MKLKQEIENYIIEASLSDANKVNENTLIFDTGLLDSMGLLFLLEFLEDNYQVKATDDEINPENFESVNSIVGFVERKLKVKESI
ncbi:acyl carrier protein [Arenibacter algicola]|uniref:Acyl carrier protein n=1 Tax=Arenibacter algicola TaxID=616991 RepID=A0ABY3ACV9_9FLAO